MDYLVHHGILGQKWGVRRYQNPDGSLTPEGRERYGRGDGRRFKKDAFSDLNKAYRNGGNKEYRKALERWGKTAEDAGVLDANDFKSIYKYASTQEETNKFVNIYKNMPSVQQRAREYDDYESKWYADMAPKLKIASTDYLDFELQEDYPDMPSKLGTKPGKETTNYLIESMKGYDERDPDRPVEQHTDKAADLYYLDKISKETFNDAYDAAAAEMAVQFLNDGTTPEAFKEYHGWYEKNNKSVSHDDYYDDYDDDDELYHHGIKGQKWGTRRWQNQDGSLTPEGYPHYGYNGPKDNSLERAYQGLKAGAIYGATQGVITTAFAMSIAAAAGPISIPFYIEAGASLMATEAFKGAILGASVGRVYGAAETAIGKASVLAANTELGKIKLSNLKKK